MLKFADEALKQGEVCGEPEKAARLPIAATTLASAFNENLRADSLFPDDAISLRASDMSPKHSLWIPDRPRNPAQARGVSDCSLIAIFGRPRCVPMDEGGER